MVTSATTPFHHRKAKTAKTRSIYFLDTVAVAYKLCGFIDDCDYDTLPSHSQAEATIVIIDT